MRRFLLSLICVLSVSSGCTMMDRMKPHQLWKLNRQKAPSGESPDGYFSIPATPDVHSGVGL